MHVAKQNQNRKFETCAGIDECLDTKSVLDMEANQQVDGGSPRSTASQDVGGLSPASSGNLDDVEEQKPPLHIRTQSLVRLEIAPISSQTLACIQSKCCRLETSC